jgi:hypothetical protein
MTPDTKVKNHRSQSNNNKKPVKVNPMWDSQLFIGKVVKFILINDKALTAEKVLASDPYNLLIQHTTLGKIWLPKHSILYAILSA